MPNDPLPALLISISSIVLLVLLSADLLDRIIRKIRHHLQQTKKGKDQ